MALDTAQRIAAVIDCWTEIERICSELDDSQWHTPTDLPGWDVQDIVAHLASTEAFLLGRAEPDHDVADAAHVRNPVGAFNERLVDRRRAWSGEEVLAEYREVTAERAAVMRGLDDAELDRQVMSPLGGEIAQRDFFRFRLWDSWLHEQDIRRALGIPERLRGAAGEEVIGEMLQRLPRALAKAGAADGATGEIQLTGAVRRQAATVVEAGRGREIEASSDPTFRIRIDAATYARTAAGRMPAHAAVAEAEVEGDRELAERVLGHRMVI